KATLVLNKKTFTGEIICSGTFTQCQEKMNEVQQASQPFANDETASDSEVDEDDFDHHDKNENEFIIEISEDYNENEEELFNRFDKPRNELLGEESRGKKRQSRHSHSASDGPRQKKQKQQQYSTERDQELNDEPMVQSSITIDQQGLLSDGKSLKLIEHKINDLNKNLVKMSNALRQMASTTRAGSQNLDHYRDANNQEIFPVTVEYCGRNLLDTIGTDFGDYARQLMRVLYTKDELQSCILPPGRQHLARPPLDAERFARLNEAVRVKYRLASHFYGDFFKYHLGPKLSDFLIEERRRDEQKNLRRQAKLPSVDLEPQPLTD
ncbi:unnamed protein product, partial [Adineta steineri]